MNNSNKTAALLLKRGASALLTGLGTLVGYGGSIAVTAFVLDPLLEPILQFVNKYFPYTLFDGRVHVSLFGFMIIVFIVSIVFLIKAIRNFNQRKEITADSPWFEFGKIYFAIGFWSGLCLFAFIWGILVPML